VKRSAKQPATSTGVVRRLTTKPAHTTQGRRAVLQLFMNRNDTLTDDAMLWVSQIERNAQAEALEYAAELFGKTTAARLIGLAARIREIA